MTTRLIPLDAEEAERLRLIADHPDNDLSPNDHGLLLALADARFDLGITEEEAEAAVLSINTRERDRVEVDELADSAREKLRSLLSHQRSTK